MNQLKGEASLREQIGGKGYFSTVSLTAEVTDGPQSNLEIQISDAVHPEWREAAVVGVRVGWGCLPAKYTHGKNVVITVESIGWQPCDTTDIVVVHVAAKALLSLFNSNSPNAPAFVPEFGVFLFG